MPRRAAGSSRAPGRVAPSAAQPNAARTSSSASALTSWMMSSAAPRSRQRAESSGRPTAELLHVDRDQQGHRALGTPGSSQLGAEDRLEPLEVLAEAGPGVALASGEARSSRALDTHDQPRRRLGRRERMRRVELVVPARVVDRAAAEQQAEDVERLGQVLTANRPCRERDAVGLVLGRMATGADAQLEAAPDELADRGRHARQHGRVAVHDVRHERPQADALGDWWPQPRASSSSPAPDRSGRRGSRSGPRSRPRRRPPIRHVARRPATRRRRRRWRSGPGRPAGAASWARGTAARRVRARHRLPARSRSCGRWPAPGPPGTGTCLPTSPPPTACR